MKKVISIFLNLLMTASVFCNAGIVANAADEEVALPTIESIEVEPITIIEGTNGYVSVEYDEVNDKEVEYYYYMPESIMNYTLVIENGPVISDTGDMLMYNDEIYWFDISTDQSYQNQWTVGNTYTMTASLMGVNVEVPVTIKKNPFKSLTIEPVTIIEQTNGYMNTDYDIESDEMFDYYYYTPSELMKYTVELFDGNVISDTGNGFEYDDEWFGFNTSTDQSYTNPWTAGNTYNMTATLVNLTVDVPVTIQKSPLKIITIEPISITEGTEGCLEYEDEYSYFCYTPSDSIKFTLEWEDGNVTSGTGNMFEYENQTYWFDISTDQSYDEPWTAGNTYTMLLSVMGVEVSVPVTIVEKEAPIKGDADLDGIVGIKDATAIQKYLVGYIDLTEEQKEAADTTGDGEVSVIDATKIQKQLVGLNY